MYLGSSFKKSLKVKLEIQVVLATFKIFSLAQIKVHKVRYLLRTALYVCVVQIFFTLSIAHAYPCSASLFPSSLISLVVPPLLSWPWFLFCFLLSSTNEKPCGLSHFKYIIVYVTVTLESTKHCHHQKVLSDRSSIESSRRSPFSVSLCSEQAQYFQTRRLAWGFGCSAHCNQKTPE